MVRINRAPDGATHVSGIQVPADLSKLLITADMVNIIVRKTNEKAAQLHQESVKNIQMLCGIRKK
ncbi:hypothetical protein T02_2145 [Trichinella nativa]|uniref:Uncharacterized protein n=1 Tax=Trichinella nativa TaxID=6335 RepID=A0A0V1KJ12_9BILA|nr:hypothetical protein T02_2145 [Trichinella nativa]